MESQRAFADRFANIAAQLRQNVADVVNADTRIGQLIDAVGLPASGGFDFFTRDHGADVVDTETAAFVMTVPVVAGVGSLSVLASQYAATNFGVPESMTGQWSALSAKVSDAVECLDGVVADLDSSSDTQAIANAIATTRALQAAGSVFATNTTTMGAATTNLGTGSFALGQQVVMAAKAYGILLATRPDVAGVFERAFLASYPATVAAALPPSIPSITQLLPSALDPSGLSAGGGGVGAFRGGDPGVGLSMWQDLPFPAVVQEAMEQVGMVEQARMRNPYELAQEFTRVGRDDLDALVAGAVPTSTASVGGPSLPPSVNPVGTVGSTPGFVVGSGMVGSGMVGSGMVGGVGTGGAGVNPAGGAGVGAGYGSGNRGGSGVGGGVGLSGRGAGGAGGAGGSGVGSRPGFGSGVGAGPSPGVGVGPGASPGVGSGAGATTGVGGHGRGGAPIGGMMGAGAGRAAGRGTGQQGVKSSSVRGIKTSAVERKGNLKALLGEGPEVIPGVIGAWVRE
ncbi:hypothetical protein, partial [Corynebacterium cystitidis]|uniref:hypothetical protein n=1 Tax=Corynebacterium cystitidis TaxID=35757 RepID=UPI00211DE32F